MVFIRSGGLPPRKVHISEALIEYFTMFPKWSLTVFKRYYTSDCSIRVIDFSIIMADCSIKVSRPFLTSIGPVKVGNHGPLPSPLFPPPMIIHVLYSTGCYSEESVQY